MSTIGAFLTTPKILDLNKTFGRKSRIWKTIFLLSINPNASFQQLSFSRHLTSANFLKISSVGGGFEPGVVWFKKLASTTELWGQIQCKGGF